MLNSEQIAKHLLSDVDSYKEFIETMLKKHLEKNSHDKIYWDAWFRGAENKALENADKGIVFQN